MKEINGNCMAGYNKVMLMYETIEQNDHLANKQSNKEILKKKMRIW